MRWVKRIVAAYLVVLALALGAVAVGGTHRADPRQPVHATMDRVSHADYELHRSIGHVT